MQFIIEMLMWCACSGGCGFLEHPAFPVWSVKHRPASTWSSRPIRWLKRLNCSAVTTFDQCLFGCEGRKPTTFLTIRLPHHRRLIQGLGHQGRCNHGPGHHPPLQGLNSRGEFNTAIAKIYPHALSAAVATAFVTFAVDLFSDVPFHEEALDSAISDLNRLDFVSKETVQPDFYLDL